jgi:hypothetical protein
LFVCLLLDWMVDWVVGYVKLLNFVCFTSEQFLAAIFM